MDKAKKDELIALTDTIIERLYEVKFAIMNNKYSIAYAYSEVVLVQTKKIKEDTLEEVRTIVRDGRKQERKEAQNG